MTLRNALTEKVFAVGEKIADQCLFGIKVRWMKAAEWFGYVSEND